MDKLRVVIRIEQDGTPALFYFDEHGQVVCFTFDEGHSVAAYSYYRDSTTGINRHPEWRGDANKINALKQRFIKQYNMTTLDFKLTLRG